MARRFESEQTNHDDEKIPQVQEDTSPEVPSVPQNIVGDILSSSRLDPAVMSYLERFNNTLKTISQRLDRLDQVVPPEANEAVQPPKTPAGRVKAWKRAKAHVACERKGKQVVHGGPRGSEGSANTDCAPGRIPMALRLDDMSRLELSRATSREHSHKSVRQGDSHYSQNDESDHHRAGGSHTPRVGLYHCGGHENSPHHTTPSHNSSRRMSRLAKTVDRGEEESDLRSFLNCNCEGRTNVAKNDPQVAPLPQIEELQRALD